MDYKGNRVYDSSFRVGGLSAEMSASSRRLPHIALLLASFITVGACAHHARLPVPSEADRASLRSIGVASAGYLPEVTFAVPAKGPGQGALAGMGMAFSAAFQAMASGGPYGMAVAIAMGAVLAPAGALIGASSAMPLVEARTSQAMLHAALAELKIQESLRDRLIAEAREEAGSRSFRIAEGGPAAPAEKPAYTPSAFHGTDYILEVRCKRLGLRTSTWGTDPPMEFFMEAGLRLVRIRDGAELWSRALSHHSQARRLSEWAEDGGKRLKETFERAYGEIAEKTVEEVFFLVPLP